MKTVAVICEYNPFHNGHARQLRQMAAVGTTVCVMSGNYVQRGEPAICDKWTRARAAALCGADLVLELPVTYALRSAEGFANGGVEVLERLGCVDALCFGSETGSAERVLSTARLLLSDAFSAALRQELATGVSFPRARELAVRRLSGEETPPLSAPNDILAVEYCKALLRRGSAIEPMLIRRDGDYHVGTDPNAPSASFLRTQERWDGCVPEAALACFAGAPRFTAAAGERAWLARLRGMPDAAFETLPFGSEGLWRRLLRACRTEETLEGIVEAAKTKRYPRTRLMRMLLCAYLGIDEALLRAQAPYIRVLAANERGQAVLRRARKNGAPLLHAGERAPACPYAGLERRADDLFGLFSTKGEYYVNQERQHRLFRPADAPPCGEK